MADVRPTVFLIDDDDAVREGLKTCLEAHGLNVAAFPSAESFLAAYQRAAPGCLVLDVKMRGMSGLELQAHLQRQEIDIPVIMITGHGDIPMAVRAMKAGAVEFLEKPVDDRKLTACISQAFTRAAEIHLLREVEAGVAQRIAQLSTREQLVMNLVIAGLSSKEIAARLGVKLKTVESHRRRVFRKMQVTKAVELARLVTGGKVPLSSRSSDPEQPVDRPPG